MNIVEALKTAFKRVFDYKWRSSRSEYWWYVLAFVLWLFLAVIIDETIFLQGANYPLLYQICEVIWVAGYIAFLVAGLPLGVRRLHDGDSSGWWLLVTLVPFGNLFLIYLMCREGTPSYNRYGPDPLANSMDVFD